MKRLSFDPSKLDISPVKNALQMLHKAGLFVDIDKERKSTCSSERIIEEELEQSKLVASIVADRQEKQNSIVKAAERKKPEQALTRNVDELFKVPNSPTENEYVWSLWVDLPTLDELFLTYDSSDVTFFQIIVHARIFAERGRTASSEAGPQQTHDGAHNHSGVT